MKDLEAFRAAMEEHVERGKVADVGAPELRIHRCGEPQQPEVDRVSRKHVRVQVLFYRSKCQLLGSVKFGSQ